MKYQEISQMLSEDCRDVKDVKKKMIHLFPKQAKKIDEQAIHYTKHRMIDKSIGFDEMLSDPAKSYLSGRSIN